MDVENSTEKNEVSPTTSENTPAQIEKIPSKFKIKSYTVNVNLDIVQVDLLKMSNSIFIWIGNKLEPKFVNLSASLIANSKESITTNILGQDECCYNIANRLSKKLNKMVFLSFNLPQEILPQATNLELVLNQLIKENKDDMF